MGKVSIQFMLNKHSKLDNSLEIRGNKLLSHVVQVSYLSSIINFFFNNYL